jgi:hypothetical protein
MFRKLLGRSTVAFTRNANVSDYQKAQEENLAAVEVEQRHLYANMAISDIAAEVENDRWENVEKLAQAHGVMTKTVHDTLHKDLQL